ncbi:SRPBCC domain-containing protein [Thalassobacillus pellis]|uniref:SRPBCC domain-containing protein n=1 Tax=Thalassobacillus pellis TaxID=748008 RepID=UPI001960E16D|nr:SRPBCC domain-containing protein [Thalassobacillus pellis]MBM7553902.1 hypothetical protein [Thalassobacillus pellis]
MSSYGELLELDGRYALKFERVVPINQLEAFDKLIEPAVFKQWYPYATGEMEMKVGGKIDFEDEEGTTYEAVITQLDRPYRFSFLEIDDLLDITIEEEREGSRLVFTHTFDDKEMAQYVAAGWHRCLDVLEQLMKGEAVVWKDNAQTLRKTYEEKFFNE